MGSVKLPDNRHRCQALQCLLPPLLWSLGCGCLSSHDSCCCLCLHGTHTYTTRSHLGRRGCTAWASMLASPSNLSGQQVGSCKSCVGYVACTSNAETMLMLCLCKAHDKPGECSGALACLLQFVCKSCFCSLASTTSAKNYVNALLALRANWVDDTEPGLFVTTHSP